MHIKVHSLIKNDSQISQVRTYISYFVEESSRRGKRRPQGTMGRSQAETCQATLGRETQEVPETEGEGKKRLLQRPLPSCQLLDKKRSGKLAISKEELERHIKGQYTDAAKDTSLGSPGHVPHPDSPKSPFDTSPPRLSEVKEVLKRARSASAPGPNGLPYKLYKNCPQVSKILWKPMCIAWKKQSIPAEWQEAVGIFIPKEQNSTNISQFRPIALLNVEGKIFFSVLSRRMTSFLSKNCYIDTSYQKGGLPGFPGCVEHASVIWEQIQRAKREKNDLHVVWLDLANAYGSVPHKLAEFALDFFHVPGCIRDIIAKYFNNLHMCFAVDDFMTGWQ